MKLFYSPSFQYQIEHRFRKPVNQNEVKNERHKLSKSDDTPSHRQADYSFLSCQSLKYISRNSRNILINLKYGV